VIPLIRRRRKRVGQGGQSLAEFVLCLPVLFMLIFGLIQLCLLGVVVAFGHYATNCALRSYTVFYSQGKTLAMGKAGQAMQAAFAWCHPQPDLDLAIQEEIPRSGALSEATYNGKGPLLFHATLDAAVPLLAAFGGARSLNLRFEACMLSEKTVETE
jgi:hypothetical protein